MPRYRHSIFCWTFRSNGYDRQSGLGTRMELPALMPMAITVPPPHRVTARLLLQDLAEVTRPDAQEGRSRRGVWPKWHMDVPRPE
jgi:hypothetical protein